MSAFTYIQRVRIAATRYDAWLADGDRWWYADMSIDAGEWSNPAIGRAQERYLLDIAIGARVLAEDVLNEITRRCYGDDPMGDFHGRNE